MIESSSDDLRKKTLMDFVMRFDTEDPKELLDTYVADFPQWESDFRGLVETTNYLVASGMEERPPPILPDFEYLGVVGRGGMGVVYKSKQISLNRTVALKLCHGTIRPEFQLRFEREQQTLAILHQSHIVPIHTAGHVGDWKYFAMKFIEGASLHQVVRTALSYSVSSNSLHTPTLKELSKLHVESQAIHLQSSSTVVSANRLTDPIKLSLDYLKSVAYGLADVADALQHAHSANILHRDVKPSNIMVDESGECWLVDFGLSRKRFIVEPRQLISPLIGNESIGDDHSIATDGTSQTNDSIGTECYISAEQYDGKCDERSDIYSFGVTLYEVLSLRRAFEEKAWKAAMDSKEFPEPIPLEKLVPAIPKDLAAICRKAMHLNSADRYATAGEVAADLRSWLAGEPTRANPAGYPRRFRLWALRNKVLAVAIISMSIALILFSVFAGLWGRSENARAVAAEQLAERRELDVLLQGLRPLHRSLLIDGWREHSLGLINKAVIKARTTTQVASLRDHAVAILSGMDVITLRNVVCDSSSVAFDASGKQLLIGGWTDQTGNSAQRATIWQLDSMKDSRPIGRFDSGPVAFQPNGTPVQLTWKNAQTLVLWNVAQDREIYSWNIEEKFEHKTHANSRIAPTVLSTDGRLSAIAVQETEGEGRVLVWNNDSGKLQHSLNCTATAIAFSRDGSMLATGNSNGVVSIWSMLAGTQESVFKNNDHSVYCLDFSHDSKLIDDGGMLLPSGRIVIGDAGSLATIRDLTTREPVCQLRGSEHWVLTAAFSPRDNLIATGGLANVTLWNSHTGQMLAKFAAGAVTTDLEFSPDGSRLAATSETTFWNGRTCLWELENGRGVSEFHGLEARVIQAVLSPDETLLAALAHNFEIALWNRAEEKFLFRWIVPQADYVDNTQIGFSLDGTRLYYSGQQEFMSWDTVSGALVSAQVRVNPALANKLAFPPSGEVLSLRVETLNGKQLPDNHFGRETDPRAFRVYHLNGDDPSKPVHSLSFSDQGEADPRTDFVCADPSPDGTVFVIDAYLTPIGATRKDGERFIKAFDALTGHEVNSIRCDCERPHRAYSFIKSSRDESGRILGILTKDEGKFIHVQLPRGEIIHSAMAIQTTIDSWNLGFVMNSTETLAIKGSAIMKCLSGGRIAATLTGVDIQQWHGFSQSGAYWIDSTTTGTVRVIDYPRIRRELTQLGLGW